MAAGISTAADRAAYTYHYHVTITVPHFTSLHRTAPQKNERGKLIVNLICDGWVKARIVWFIVVVLVPIHGDWAIALCAHSSSYHYSASNAYYHYYCCALSLSLSLSSCSSELFLRFSFKQKGRDFRLFDILFMVSVLTIDCMIWWLKTNRPVTTTKSTNIHCVWVSARANNQLFVGLNSSVG